MSGAEILLEPGVIPRLLQGLWVTVWIAGVSVALSVPVGLIVGWLMTMKNPVVRVLTRIYLDFIRIMPQLALLFIAFYGFAQAWNWNLDATGSARCRRARPAAGRGCARSRCRRRPSRPRSPG